MHSQLACTAGLPRRGRGRAVNSVINLRVAKCQRTKPRRTAASVKHTAAYVVRTRRRRSVTGSTLYAGEEVKPLPDTTPLVITPFSAAVGHRRTEPGGYFCWKLTLTRTPDPIRPTRRGPDLNRPTNGSKQGGYDLGVFVRGVLIGHRRRQ